MSSLLASNPNTEGRPGCEAGRAADMTNLRQRIPEFDITKGVLVLCMVLYHWLNYFIGLGRDFYRYLMFLTPSFIFITGFLITYVSISRYAAAPEQFGTRLTIRGIKLLAIFIFLNLSIALLLPGSAIRQALFGHLSLATLKDIFVTGDVVMSGIGKTASFTILVPISYLLIAVAGLLKAERAFRYTFHVACGAALVSALVLNRMGVSNAFLELLGIGLLGLVFGYTPKARVTRLTSRPYVIALAYCGYLVVITLLNVPFLLRIVGVCLTLAVIYVAGARLGEPLRRYLSVLGRYSLLGYIAQIGILQILHRAAAHIGGGVWILPQHLSRESFLRWLARK